MLLSGSSITNPWVDGDCAPNAPTGAGVDANATQLTMSAEIQPKGGIFAGITAKILERRLPKRALVILKDLATSAEKIA